jgi:hypothetical protein
MVSSHVKPTEARSRREAKNNDSFLYSISSTTTTNPLESLQLPEALTNVTLLKHTSGHIAFFSKNLRNLPILFSYHFPTSSTCHFLVAEDPACPAYCRGAPRVPQFPPLSFSPLHMGNPYQTRGFSSGCCIVSPRPYPRRTNEPKHK